MIVVYSLNKQRYIFLYKFLYKELFYKNDCFIIISVFWERGIMTKEELLKLKEEIMKLSDEEKKDRKLYLRGLAKGDIQGPPVDYASIDKPWLKAYSEEAVTLSYPKMRLYDYLYENNLNNINTIAINYFGKKITYNDLFNNIYKAAKSFSEMGIKCGDVVTICMPTLPESIYAMYALNRIGAICNLVDPRINIEQIMDSVNSTNSKYAVIIDLCHPKFDKIFDRTGLKKIISVSVKDSLPPVLKCGMRLKTWINYLKSKETPLPNNGNYIKWDEFIKLGKDYYSYIDCNYEENMPAVIVRTSGSTGTPKSVVHSNESVNALAHQYNYCGVPHKVGDRFLNIMPLFLMYGLSCGIHMPLSLGMTNVLVPQFNIETFDKLVMKSKPQHFMGIPAMYEKMLNSSKMKNFDLSFLITPGVGGDWISDELHDNINKFLSEHHCGYKLEPGYGMTEAGAAMGALINMDNYKVGSCAMPFFLNSIASFEYSVDDNEKVTRTENELPYGEVGELCFTGPTTMLYYLNREEQTKEVLKKHSDGSLWIHTNDFGYVDKDGLVFYKGRINDERIARSDGHKASRTDIEKCIKSYPLVEEVTVVAMKDPLNSNFFLPKAVVKLKEHNGKSEQEIVDDIIEFASHTLAPRDSAYFYEIVKDFPLTGSGKIDRAFLKNNVIGNMYDADIQVESMIESKKLVKKQKN